MSPESASLKESPCSEKLRISEDLAATLNAMREIASREIWTATTGDAATLDQLGIEMEQATKRKDALMAAYMAHVAKHGC